MVKGEAYMHRENKVIFKHGNRADSLGGYSRLKSKQAQELMWSRKVRPKDTFLQNGSFIEVNNQVQASSEPFCINF